MQFDIINNDNVRSQRKVTLLPPPGRQLAIVPST